jgi:hypothetical protein
VNPADLLAALPADASGQVAGEVHGTPQYGGPPLRAAAVRRGAARLRCASLLKPLLVWAAAHTSPWAGDPEGWAAHGEDAVTRSDNAATNRIWHGTGPARLLDRLAAATGVRWTLPGGDPTWFGGIEVSATEIVTAYGALARAAAGDPSAARVLDWMRRVAPEQSFGARAALAAGFGCEPGTVAVKAGWFGHAEETALRTHVVAVAERDGETVVIAALSALPYPDPTDRDRYRRDLPAGRLIREHERLAGSLLRGLVEATGRDLVWLSGR